MTYLYVMLILSSIATQDNVDAKAVAVVQGFHSMDACQDNIDTISKELGRSRWKTTFKCLRLNADSADTASTSGVQAGSADPAQSDPAKQAGAAVGAAAASAAKDAAKSLFENFFNQK